MERFIGILVYAIIFVGLGIIYGKIMNVFGNILYLLVKKIKGKRD